MLEALFQVIISPLYGILEAIFTFFTINLCLNIGFAIFIISFIVNALSLPLYINAERLQEKERDIQNKLAPRVNSIKKNFKGDERHMILQTYYRQNHYHPVMALRLSLSLLLTIPFFTAAYMFFHNLPLENVSWFIIKDLAKPDGLLSFGNFSLNVLPVLMTVLNIISVNIYAKDKDFMEKVQMYGLAALFLVILYQSPSCLVLYWTFNNLFSLLKNLSFKYFSLEVTLNKTMLFLGVAVVIPALVYGLIRYPLCLIVLLLAAFGGYKIFKGISFDTPSTRTYFLICAALSLLIGVLIPTNVISTSPVEFLYGPTSKSPLFFIIFPLLQAFGLFVFWGGVAYFFSSKKVQCILTFIAAVFLPFSLLNMFFIPLPKEYMLKTLVYNCKVSFDFYQDSILPLIAYVVGGLCVVSLLHFVFKNYRYKLLDKIVSILLMVFVSLAAINVFKISNVYKNYVNNVTDFNTSSNSVYNLSREHKNVIIIFLDRAISSFLPLIFEEKPELKSVYSGFTYYPNTVSYYSHTVLGYPAMIGGYEYSPIRMNMPNNKVFHEKYREALLTLPLIYKNAGWNVKVTDAPYLYPEIFKSEGISAANVRGKLSEVYGISAERNKANQQLTKRNFIYLSFLVASPPPLRNFIYEHGRYLSVWNCPESIWYDDKLIQENYLELENLSGFTGFNSKSDSFVIINNDLPHWPAYLQYPEYKYAKNVKVYNPLIADNSANMHYHVNAASLFLVGKYLDYLKENNAYDNSRIIIVADHGRSITNPKLSKLQNDYLMEYNPLLLVKDFNSRGDLKVSDKFMTNADVPYIATQNIIDKPVNPFTGNVISDADKQNGVWIYEAHIWQFDFFRNNKSFILPKATFRYVNKNIFDVNNWKIHVPYSKINPQ